MYLYDRATVSGHHFERDKDLNAGIVDVVDLCIHNNI
jgi:hypothetical protein